MKDSTVFVLLGLLCMVWVLFFAMLGAGILPLAGFCSFGLVLLGFGLASLADDN